MKVETRIGSSVVLVDMQNSVRYLSLAAPAAPNYRWISSLIAQQVSINLKQINNGQPKIILNSNFIPFIYHTLFRL
ncbi:hypothetical protein FL863_14395 [Listeria monocytogenes]|nr:hypothetical protein [Listeria monocytogenes]